MNITIAHLGWTIAALLVAGYVLGWIQTWFLNRYEVTMTRRRPRGVFRPRISRRWYAPGDHVCLSHEAGGEKPDRYLVIGWDSEAVAVPWLLVDNLDSDEQDGPSWLPVTAFAPFTVRRLRPYVYRDGWMPVVHLRDYLPLRQPAGLPRDWCLMLPVLFGITVAAGLVLAVSFASRRLHASRVARAAGGPPARPAPQPAGRAAVPVITDAPDREERGAFAYDNGVHHRPP